MSHIRRLLSAALLFSAPWILFAENEERFSEAELDQMLAPIALYPDALLAQILTASTYPLEIVAAERWLQEHKNLEGDQAVEAAESKNWDPSVTALVAFPDILKRMNDDLEWTQRLGEAVLIQQEEVMASVQKLREKAYTAGNLRSHEEVEVRREKEIIYIESSNPRVVYVPYYNPTIVYGSWWWHSHPPVYWGPSTFVSIRTGSTRIVWSSGYRFSTHYFYSRPDWHRRHIVVHHHYHNRQKPNYVHRSRRDWDRYSSDNRWQHQPRHRRGARYQSTTARERFSHRNHPTETTRTARERPNSANPAIQNRAERRSEAVRSNRTVSPEQIQQRLARSREERRNTQRRIERPTSQNNARRSATVEQTPQRPNPRQPFVSNQNRRSSPTVRSEQPTAQENHSNRTNRRSRESNATSPMIRQRTPEARSSNSTPTVERPNRPTPRAERPRHRSRERSAMRNANRVRSQTTRPTSQNTESVRRQRPQRSEMRNTNRERPRTPRTDTSARNR